VPVELIYPERAPKEHQREMEMVLAKAEVSFLTATRDVPLKDVQGWEHHAFQMVETVVVAFANLVGERLIINKYLKSVSEYAFGQLPDHPKPTVMGDYGLFRQKDFVKKAELHVKHSEGWLKHLETSLIASEALDDLDDSVDDLPNEALLKGWMDGVEKKEGHRPTEKELYDRATVSRAAFTNWKKGTAGDKIHKLITEEMDKHWDWKKMDNRWKVTIHVILTMIPPAIS